MPHVVKLIHSYEYTLCYDLQYSHSNTQRHKDTKTHTVTVRTWWLNRTDATCCQAHTFLWIHMCIHKNVLWSSVFTLKHTQAHTTQRHTQSHTWLSRPDSTCCQAHILFPLKMMTLRVVLDVPYLDAKSNCLQKRFLLDLGVPFTNIVGVLIKTIEN